MLVYRIVHKKYANSLFAGGMEGRWNSEGKKVLYTAGNVSLAYLETLHHRRGLGFNNDFRIMVIYLPPHASFLDIATSQLPLNWRNFRNYNACQRIGDDWFDRSEHLCLRVPSAVVPENQNVIINTLHPGYKKVKLVETLPFTPDERLEEVIKRYP
ncbi:MAG: RES family NAD+ phosphorylase [Leadbetterella sp.]|nr:RES family NAD+ phosphorylase [Leadbetterella sp.]